MKQHDDVLTYRIARSVQLFWAPFLTQNLVLVFAQVNIKEYENELFSFNVTFVKSSSPTRITPKFFNYNSFLGVLFLNSSLNNSLVVRGGHVGALYLGGVMTVILYHASLLLKKNCSGYICNLSRVYK